MLDAWAVMALLRNERGAEAVERMVADGEAVMSAINLGEVLYALLRSHGPQVAASRVEGIRQTVWVEQPDWPLVERAAAVKAQGGISYADAFCVATALRVGAPIATGDPEILALTDVVEAIDLTAS
ncbi:MAG: type II toxin-antitoxin system VapC family toxin [Gammaproteobacteria bacterium]